MDLGSNSFQMLGCAFRIMNFKSKTHNCPILITDEPKAVKEFQGTPFSVNVVNPWLTEKGSISHENVLEKLASR